jgi:hypothetical protein
MANQARNEVNAMEIDSAVSHPAISAQRKFYIAVDYGTTYSAVSFAVQEPGESPEQVPFERIHNIIHFPDDPRPSGCAALEVPTELCYRRPPVLAPKPRVRRSRRTGNVSDPMELDSSTMANNTATQTQETTRLNHAIDDIPQYRVADDSPEGLEVPENICWGYKVRTLADDPDIGPAFTEYSTGRVQRAKLLLDESLYTEKARENLKPIFEALKGIKRDKKAEEVKSEDDLIVHFLEQLFRHVKQELTLHHGYTTQCHVEYIICVPPIWSSKACRRMEYAMAKALRRCKLLGRAVESIDNMFIVAEPEAAATYILLSSSHKEDFRVRKFLTKFQF